MKKLVHSIDKVVEHLFMGNSYRDQLIDKIKELEENVE